jgi:hypothetical protein
MLSSKKRIAIKSVAALLLAATCGLAMAAQVAGTVINLSGALMARKANGAVKVLAVRSEVEQGDTLVSEKNTYAQIKFIDNSEITMQPGTTFHVEAFSFDAARPEGDSASFNLVKGGLRSITGLLGKRNKEKFQLKTPTATIGIRGTTFIAQYVGPQGAGGIPTPGGSIAPLTPGLHVFVSDGAIVVSNPAGAQSFTAGQFGYTANTNTLPVMVPSNPALKFVPPPAFNLPVATTSTQPPKSAAVDCEVR